MREELVNRLNSSEILITNPNYLVYKSFHSELFRCLEKYSSGKLLDIGCGNKPYQQIVVSSVDEYIGCDIVQSSEKKVDILCDATNIPLPDESFNTIISTQTIEHLSEPQLLINEAYRLLKQNGIFILSGPMYWPLHEEPYDFFRFTKYGFRYIITKAGFTIEEEKANGGKWALCGQVLIHSFYSDLSNHNSLKWKVCRGFIEFIGGVKNINKFFAKLDERYTDTNNTMNYVFVARK
jgi:SAM-dependent methyltransferase